MGTQAAQDCAVECMFADALHWAGFPGVAILFFPTVLDNIYMLKEM